MATATLDEAALNAELSRAIKQIHALNISITTERERGNLAGVEAMLPLYRSWVARYQDVSRQLGKLEGLNAFDKFILDTGNYVQQAATALPNAIAALPQGVGVGIIKGFWPFALIAVGYLWYRGKL